MLGSWYFRWMFTSHYVSHVRCHVSDVTCQVSCFRCFVSRVTCHKYFFFFFLIVYVLAQQGIQFCNFAQENVWKKHKTFVNFFCTLVYFQLNFFTVIDIYIDIDIDILQGKQVSIVSMGLHYIASISPLAALAAAVRLLLIVTVKAKDGLIHGKLYV